MQSIQIAGCRMTTCMNTIEIICMCMEGSRAVGEGNCASTSLPALIVNIFPACSFNMLKKTIIFVFKIRIEYHGIMLYANQKQKQLINLI